MPEFLNSKHFGQRNQNTSEIVEMAIKNLCSEIEDFGQFGKRYIPKSYQYIMNSDACQSN